ncbi:MAG: ATP-grasp domain-containing protein [Candidatus Fermentibacteria bacterium]
MSALPEYRTRVLLQRNNVQLVDGVFVSPGEEYPASIPEMPLYLKAQIPGATSRKKHGLVRRVDTHEELEQNLDILLSPGVWGQAEGVLITKGLDLMAEYYAGCMLDFGSENRLPGGILLFSTEGGSGVESRSGTLLKMHFSLLHPPDQERIETELNKLEGLTGERTLSELLYGMICTFIGYKLNILEINPLAVLNDGSVVAVDCRAEFEKAAVSKADMDLFFPPGPGSSGDLTELEQIVEHVNRDDPSGTGFFRQNRETPPEGALRVATNLCGGGGKMLWEMTTGSRTDIFTMNESDTSGGLSAFKSYRILRVILSQENAQVLLLTGSGMAFQNQHHLAAAVWKALRESPTPLPSLLRFGGTDEDKARELFERVKDTLTVPVKTYPAVIFPNAMVDDIMDIAGERVQKVIKYIPPEGKPEIIVDIPPGKIYFYPEKWDTDEIPPSVKACPTGFLKWDESGLSTDPEARCIGCLMCETAALLDGNAEILIKLEVPEVVD